MKRKVIQIVNSAVPEESGFLYALCDDGTMWYCACVSLPHWTQITDVPQPDPPSAEEITALREAADRRRVKGEKRLEELRKKQTKEEEDK